VLSCCLLSVRRRTRFGSPVWPETLVEMARVAFYDPRGHHACFHRSRRLRPVGATSSFVYCSPLAWLRRGHSLFIRSSYETSHPGNRMNQQLRAISELDRVIHEPGRLMIVALLSAFKECDFLYLLHETEMNKGNLPATWRGWRKLLMSKFKKNVSRQSAPNRASAHVGRSQSI